jgi:hypothetical protein
MAFAFPLISLAAHLAALIRLLTYQRNGARHRHRVSWLAWALVVVIGGSLIQLTLNPERAGFFETAMAVVLAIFVNRVRGNVARLLWSE